MNTLQTTAISVAAALKLAKPYVGSLRKKNPGGRPILKCALVNEEYVIATNAHFLIRIRHNESITEPYLHHFKEEYKEFIGNMTAKNYPQTERLIPNKYMAIASGPVEVKKMYEAAAGAQVIAAQSGKILMDVIRVHLEEDKIHTKDAQKTPHDVYTHRFDRLIPVTEETCFNGDYLKQVFRTFKQHKEKNVDMFYYGPTRPIYLVAGAVEVVLLPCIIN